MADIQSNIQVNIDTSEALASIRLLQKQISAFHSQMAKGGAAANAVTSNLQQNLINSLNATGKFSAEMRTVKTTTESFTNALEKNKLSMREYFRFSAASTKTFGRLFRSEFETINKVARERVKDLQTQYIKMGRDANGALKAIAVRPLALDMDNLATKTAIAAQKQALLNQMLKQGSTNLLNFGKNTQWAGRQLMVGFTVPLTMLGTVAAKTFMAMEEQAIRFRRVYGEMFTTASETEDMLKQIKALGKEFTKYGVEVEKTMSMAASAAAMGKQGADLLAQVNQATRLAVLGGVEQEQALETTISLTNAFGTAAESLAGKIDFLNSVENQTVTSIEDLTIAIPKAGPVVQQLGGDVEDLTFFLTAMKEGGINASEGANALKSGLASLINPTDKASAFLGDLGINIKGIVEANKGDVQGIVVDFAKALDTLDPLNRARAIEQLFGKFQFARLSTLFQNVIKQGSQAERVLKLSNATAEELAILSERELKRVEESPMYKFKAAIEELKVSLVPLGEAFVKAVTPIVEFGTKVLEKFNGMSDGAKSFLVGLTGIAGVIAPAFLMTFGLVANGVANLIKLFVSIKSIYNKVSGSSQVLGQTTDYMTQQQLEAAAVASSLEQAHMRLSQAFTSERAALDALTNAYRRAIAAQAQYAGAAIPGRGKPVKKYNNGVFMVPGSGNRDTVPAMLTPGEAVIPAKAAQDPINKPFIEAMVTGRKLPGFMSGVSSAFAHASMPFAPGSEQYIKGIQIFGLEELAKQFPQFVRVVSNLVVELPQKLNIALQKGTAKVEDFERAWNARQGKFLTAARLGGGDITDPALRASLANLEKQVGIRATEIARQTAAEKGASAKVVVSDEMLARATRETIDDFMKLEGSARNAAMALDKSSRQLGQVRTNLPASVIREGLASGKLKKVPGRIQNGKVGQSNILFGSVNVGRESRSKPGKFYPGNPFNFKGSYAKGEVKRSIDAYVSGISDDIEKSFKEELEQKSPSRRMRRIGKDAGKGLILGVQDQTAQAHSAGKRLASAIVGGVTAGTAVATKASQSRNLLYGTGPIDSQQKSLRRQQQKLDRARAAQEKKATQSRNLLYGGQTGPISSQEKSLRRQLEKRKKLADLEAKRAYSAGTIVGQPSATRQKPTFGQRVGGAVKNVGTKVGTKFRGMGTGGAGMAASGAVMMASMLPGQVGQTAQDIMMPVMALSMALPLLKTPLGALVAVVGSAAAAIYMLNQKFKESQEEALKLGDTMGASQNAVRKMSEFAGTVSAGEYMDRVRENRLKGVTSVTGKTTFGEAYVQSEAGKEVISGAQAMLAKGDKSGVIQQLSAQLSSGIMSGALNMDQAKSMAANIASQLGDASIGIKVVAQITELLGPDGKAFENSPITVATKVSEDSIADFESKMQAFQEQANQAGPMGLFGSQLGRDITVAGSVAAGAGIGAKGGAMIGSIFGPAGTGAGALLGAGIGAIAGGVFAYSQIQKSAEELGKLSGAAVASMKNALSQQQEMSDALDAYYIKKIAEAQAEGDIAEAKRLQLEYDKKKAELGKVQAETAKALMDTYNSASDVGREALDTGAKNATDLVYKDDVDAQLFLPSVREKASKANKNVAGLSYLVELQMSSKNMTPAQVDSILSLAGEDAKKQQQVFDIITNFGGKAAAEFDAVSRMMENEDNQAEFMLRVSTAKNKKEAEQIMNFAQRVMKMDGVFDADVVLSIAYADPKAKAEMDKVFAGLDEKDVNTVDLAYQVNPKLKLTGKEGDAFNEEYYNQLKDVASKELYIETISVIMAMPEAKLLASPDFTNWLNDEGAKYVNEFGKPGTPGGKSNQWWQRTYAESQGQKVTETAPTTDSTTAPDTTTTDQNNNTKKEDPYEDILTSLKRVRDASINASGGAKELKRVLGGSKDIKVFKGMEQSLVGMNEQFTQYLMGLDTKTRKTFVTFKNGKAILSDLGKAMRKAFDEKVLGDFQLKQLQTSANIANQNKAFARLTKAGFDAGSAYDAVADAAFAAAVANKKLSDKELKKIAKAWKDAKKASDQYSRIQALTTENEAYAKQVQVLQKLESVAGKYTQDQISEILGSTEKMDQFLINPNNPKFVQNMQDILDKKKFDIRVKMLSIEGQEEIFNDGFNKAMEAFAAQEQKIELDFQVKNKEDLEAIADAENEIAKLQYKIDDWEAGLQDIEKQEENINKTYEAKFSALDKVQKANEAISRQQKSQLTLADALSQGDIAAAAKAAQEMRAQAAADSISEQRSSLEQAKENELANVRNALGYTREQIETSIRDLQDQIFQIEEKTLEPAQERIRLAEIEKQKAIDSLTVLGMSRLEWEQVKNRIDLAKTSSKEYEEAMKLALSVVEKIVAYWNGLNKTVTTTHIINTIHTTSGGGGTVTDQYGIMEKSGLAQTHKDYFEKTVLPAIEDGTASPSQVIDYANAVNEALGRPQGTPVALAKGGIVPGMKYFLNGGFAKGTDTVPAMLTPGEFIVSKFAVKDFGVDRLKAINSGTYDGGSVYNYNLSVNVKSDANPDEIANTVMTQIRQIESRRLRGVRV